jgi:hypothetical protein
MLSEVSGHKSMADLHQNTGSKSLRYRGSISPVKMVRSPMKKYQRNPQRATSPKYSKLHYLRDDEGNTFVLDCENADEVYQFLDQYKVGTQTSRQIKVVSQDLRSQPLRHIYS